MIYFFAEEVTYPLSEDQEKNISAWIQKVVELEKHTIGCINYIFCSDEYLHNINLSHLKHDTYTDIITFDYCENNIITTDIFISVDRVKENAKKFKKTFIEELCRVMVHGVLHLVGYKDKTKTEQTIMREKEDFYLTLCPI
jgi:rRNA maturation RNase YbeY